MVIRNQQVQAKEQQFNARKQVLLNSKNPKNQIVNNNLAQPSKSLKIRNFILPVGFLAIVFMALLSTQASKPGNFKIASKPVLAASVSAAKNTQPIDKLIAVNIAATVAQEADLSVAPIMTNQADSMKAQVAMRQDDSNTTLVKPQALATLKQSSNTVTNYKVKEGDSVPVLAKKFGISTDTIKWANDLVANDLAPGKTIKILPIDGVLYTVADGDTAKSIASKFSSEANLIISFNDAEITGLKTSQSIIVPGGVQADVPAVDTNQNPNNGFDSGSSSFAVGTFKPVYTGNGYGYGYCTWYVASMINVPNNWGNANTWAYYAGVTPGWSVSSNPTVGSIAQTSLGWAGHVAIVTGVSADGSQVTISEMNGPAGWNVVDTQSVPTSSYVYISR